MCTFLTISRSVILRIRNVSDKSYRGKAKHILCSVIFFSEKRVAYEIMWKNIVEPDRPQMTSIAHAQCMLDT